MVVEVVGMVTTPSTELVGKTVVVVFVLNVFFCLVGVKEVSDLFVCVLCVVCCGWAAHTPVGR